MDVRNEIESASKKLLKFVSEIRDDDRFYVKYRPHPGEQWYKSNIPPHLVSSEPDYHSFVSACDGLIVLTAPVLFIVTPQAFQLPVAGQAYRAPYFDNIPAFRIESILKNQLSLVQMFVTL